MKTYIQIFGMIYKNPKSIKPMGYFTYTETEGHSGIDKIFSRNDFKRMLKDKENYIVHANHEQYLDISPKQWGKYDVMFIENYIFNVKDIPVLIKDKNVTSPDLRKQVVKIFKDMQKKGLI